MGKSSSDRKGYGWLTREGLARAIIRSRTS